MNEDEAVTFLNQSESEDDGGQVQPESMTPDEAGPQYVPQVRASGMSDQDALKFLESYSPEAKASIGASASIPVAKQGQGMSDDQAMAFLSSYSPESYSPEQTGKTINLPAMPWYENLAKSTAAQTAASFIRQAEGFERAGAAPVTDLSRVNAPFQRAGTSEEVTSTFDKSIADQEALLSNLQSVADKKGFVSSDLKRQMDAAKQQIGNLQIQKQQTLERPEYSEQAQQELLQERQQMGQEATQLEQKAKGMFPYFGVNASDESVSAQIGRGLGTFAGLAPAMVTGPLSLPIMATQGASQAYAEGYNAKAEELKNQGITDQGAIDKEAHQAGSQAAVGSVPQLAAYMVGGALTTKATSALLKGSSPIVKGLVGGTAAAGVNLATSGGLRVAQGGSFAPTTEQSVPDILFGAIHGVGSFAQARAETKAKIDASIGGPEPKVNPSENSAVNEREAQILAGADAQASVPEGVVAEPTTTVAETKASETAPAPDLTSLILDQTLYDEGSAEWNAIQAQIDALNKPAEAPAEAQPTTQRPELDAGDKDTGAYHLGDLGIASDTTFRRMDSGRGTGHFGTGTYFLGKKSAATKASEGGYGGRVGRPVANVNLEGLNLAKPSDPYALHNALKLVNQMVYKNEKPDFSQERFNGSKALFNLNVELGISKHSEAEIQKAIEDTYNEFASGKNDGLRSPSTVLMQKLGYDGIDVRGTKLDNTDYGSVIYPKQPTEEKPNAIQVTSATEAMLRPQVTGQGEVVELSGVGEQKPEVPSEEAQAPKEEVKPPLPKETKNEFLDFAKKQGGLTKAQAQKALAEYEKAGNITIGDNGEMLFTKPENSTRESLRKAAGIEEAPTASKSQPIRDLLRRFQSGEEDSIDTLKGLADAVSDLARKTKNKRLADLSSELEEAVSLGVEIEDAEKLVERSLAAMEDEAIMIDSPKKGKQPTRQKRTKKDKEMDVFGEGANGLRYVLDNKILDPIQYKRMVKAKIIKGGGEYDFFYSRKLPKKVRNLIFKKDGSPIDEVAKAMGKTPDELLTQIQEAYISAEKANEETKALEKQQADIEENFRKMAELEKTDPEAHASAVEEEVRTYLRNQLRREGGYTELPQIIYDAAVSVGRSVAKAARDFKSWSGEMVSRFGDGVKGYLRQIWGSIKGSWNKDIGGGFDTGGRSRERAMGEAERYGPKAPTEQEAFAKKASDAILKGRGTPITQEEMASILARKFPGISPAEVADLYATASGKPKPSAAYAGGVGAMPQGEMFSERTTGLKKAVVKEERLARGLEDIPVQERQSEEERVQRAVDRVSADPSVAPSIISRIVDAKQPNISVDDAAALLVERNRLMNDRGTWDNVLDDESKSPAERNYAKERLDQIEKEMERLDRAQRATGSEWGRLGRIYQRMIKEDYSLEAMERKERRNLGRPLEKSEREAIKKEADSIKETADKLDKAREELSNAQEKDEVRDAYWKTIKELEAELATRPKIEPQIQRIIDRVRSTIKSQADKARERVQQRIKEGRFNAGLNPEDIIDHAIIGADYILEGATDIVKFTNRMRKELGEYVLPHIKEIFAASQQQVDRTTDREAGGKSEVVKEKQKPQQQTSISEIKATGKAEKVANPFLPNLETLQDPLTHKLVYELARQHILEGVKGEDNVMKAVHNDIKDVYPDATERDVRRAFSEYAKVKFPSTAADRVALAEIRTLTRLQESIDRLEEGLPALRTGLQRNKATQEIREKQKKLNELLKKVKLPPTAEELASRDAAKQTALRNRIADLEKQLRTGEKVKRTPAEPDSQATEDLRLEKNALEQLLKEVEGKEKPQKTPEERYNENRQKAIRKRIAEIQNRIDKGLYEKPPKRIPKPKFEYIQRLELELKRKQNEFERRQLKHLEERKPRWQKLLQGTSEMAKGFAITGYHSLEKILGFDLAKMVSTPIEEFTGAAVSLLPGMKPKEGQIEAGGGTTKGLIAYYKGLVKGAIEAPKVFKTGLSESEELFGKVRPNVARWYDWIGGRLHASLKHIPFTAQEELYRYRGLANAEKASPGSTKNDLVRTAIYKAAYEKAQSAKLQEANTVAEAINNWHRRMEQVDPKTGKSSMINNTVSSVLKTFITKGIIKTPANYFKQVMQGIFGLPVGAGKLANAYWKGVENLTPVESDAIYKALKVGGIGFAAGLYGFIDSFKDKKDRVLGGYYQAGRKEGDGDAKWGTIRINGRTFHYIAHNPVTEIMQFGSTLGRIYQATVKKSDAPTAIATGFAKSMISLLGNAPVSGPLMRLGQPYSNPVNEIAGGLVPALVSNIATDMDEGNKRKATNPWEAMKVRIPGLRETVPVSRSGKPSSNKPFYKSDSSKPFYKSDSSKPFYKK